MSVFGFSEHTPRLSHLLHGRRLLIDLLITSILGWRRQSGGQMEDRTLGPLPICTLCLNPCLRWVCSQTLNVSAQEQLQGCGGTGGVDPRGTRCCKKKKNRRTLKSTREQRDCHILLWLQFSLKVLNVWLCRKNTAHIPDQ